MSYMVGSTWDVLGIPGYYVLRDWGVYMGGKYLGCPWYPRIPCIEGLGGVYMEGSTWDVLGIPGYYVLRDWGGLYEVPGMSLVSRDTMY